MWWSWKQSIKLIHWEVRMYSRMENIWWKNPIMRALLHAFRCLCIKMPIKHCSKRKIQSLWNFRIWNAFECHSNRNFRSFNRNPLSSSLLLCLYLLKEKTWNHGIWAFLRINENQRLKKSYLQKYGWIQSIYDG